MTSGSDDNYFSNRKEFSDGDDDVDFYPAGRRGRRPLSRAAVMGQSRGARGGKSGAGSSIGQASKNPEKTQITENVGTERATDFRTGNAEKESILPQVAMWSVLAVALAVAVFSVVNQDSITSDLGQLQKDVEHLKAKLKETEDSVLSLQERLDEEDRIRNSEDHGREARSVLSVRSDETKRLEAIENELSTFRNRFSGLESNTKSTPSVDFSVDIATLKDTMKRVDDKVRVVEASTAKTVIDVTRKITNVQDKLSSVDRSVEKVNENGNKIQTRITAVEERVNAGVNTEANIIKTLDTLDKNMATRFDMGQLNANHSKAVQKLQRDFEEKMSTNFEQLQDKINAGLKEAEEKSGSSFQGKISSDFDSEMHVELNKKINDLNVTLNKHIEDLNGTLLQVIEAINISKMDIGRLISNVTVFDEGSKRLDSRVEQLLLTVSNTENRMEHIENHLSSLKQTVQVMQVNISSANASLRGNLDALDSIVIKISTNLSEMNSSITLLGECHSSLEHNVSEISKSILEVNTKLNRTEDKAPDMQSQGNAESLFTSRYIEPLKREVRRVKLRSIRLDTKQKATDLRLNETILNMSKQLEPDTPTTLPVFSETDALQEETRNTTEQTARLQEFCEGLELRVNATIANMTKDLSNQNDSLEQKTNQLATKIEAKFGILDALRETSKRLDKENAGLSFSQMTVKEEVSRHGNELEQLLQRLHELSSLLSDSQDNIVQQCEAMVLLVENNLSGEAYKNLSKRDEKINSLSSGVSNTEERLRTVDARSDVLATDVNKLKANNFILSNALVSVNEHIKGNVSALESSTASTLTNFNTTLGITRTKLAKHTHTYFTRTLKFEKDIAQTMNQVTKHGLEIAGVQNGAKRTNENLDKLEITTGRMETNIYELRTDISAVRTQLIDDLGEVNKTLHRTQNELINMNNSLGSGLEDFREKYKNKVEEVEGMFGLVQRNLFNKESLIMVIVVMAFVQLLHLLLTYKTFTTRSRSVDQTEVPLEANDTSLPKKSPLMQTAKAVLQQVRPKTLDKGVCVVSFYEETQAFHEKLSMVVFKDNEKLEAIERSKHYVRQHQDVLGLPPVRLYFVFVDFNERHVILEDPTLGLGDLRLTTVRAIQKMGGSLVVIYVKERESKNLQKGHLYNTSLASVTSQHELCVLNSKGRIFSTYDTLNAEQIEKLQSIVLEELQIR